MNEGRPCRALLVIVTRAANVPINTGRNLVKTGSSNFTVLIDTHYSGEVFNVVVSDTPLRRDETVTCEYTVEADELAKIAVKIVDVLGEETMGVEEQALAGQGRLVLSYFCSLLSWYNDS